MYYKTQTKINKTRPNLSKKTVILTEKGKQNGAVYQLSKTRTI